MNKFSLCVRRFSIFLIHEIEKKKKKFTIQFSLLQRGYLLAAPVLPLRIKSTTFNRDTSSRFQFEPGFRFEVSFIHKTWVMLNVKFNVLSGLKMFSRL
jgi:hypothetical protein